MATWSNQNVILTEAGRNLLSFAQAGNGGIVVTKVVPGSGRVANASLPTQTAVSSPKAEMEVTGKTSSPTGSIISAQLNNTGLATAYDLTQIGVYASNPNTGEVLYLIAQCDAGTEDTIPVPTVTPTILNFSFHLIHGSEAAVSVTVSNAGLVSSVDFANHRHDNATLVSDGFMSKEDKVAHNTLVTRINQALNTTSSPTFAAATIGAVTIAADGTITGAKFT